MKAKPPAFNEVRWGQTQSRIQGSGSLGWAVCGGVGKEVV